MIFKNCGIGDKSTMFHSYFMVYERFSLFSSFYDTSPADRSADPCALRRYGLVGNMAVINLKTVIGSLSCPRPCYGPIPYPLSR